MSELDTNSEDSQNLATPSQADIVGSQPGIVRVDTEWDAPLPSPAAFRIYEDTVSGAGNRILKMAETEQSNQHELQMAQHEHELAALEVVRTGVVLGSLRSVIGMALGTAIAVLGILSGTYLIVNGHGLSGMTFFVASLASLVGVSVYGISVQSAERRRNAEDIEDTEEE